MKFQQFSALLTLSLGSLIVWGTPIIPDANNGTGLGDGTDAKPTFYADLGVISHKPNNTEVDEYAKKGYESMMDQKPRSDKDTHLMAALYIKAKGLWLCSVPDGPAIGHIKKGGEDGDAPAWWSQVKDRKPSLHLHAEDCAAFRYENSLKTKLKAGDKYPEGSYISVYGSVNEQGAKKVSLCSGGGDRPLDPPCSKVFNNLGVKH
ncbi:hypothetical protein PG987_005155 [Apiospora arundinis]|uniref:Uncharacterized protein n=1 Tax=Apiospora arundinis TaxID=335852 RepID=A0ABR2JGA4_9PEZI